MKRYAALLALSVLTLLTLASSAQEPATGLPPFGSFQDGDFDAVNRQNLNVNFTIPIVSAKGRGLDFSFAITYNSLIWQRPGFWTPTVNQTGEPTWGWQLNAPDGYVRYNYASEYCNELYPERGSLQTYSDYRYTDGDGTVHTFPVTYMVGCTGNTSGTTGGHAGDNSGYYIVISDPNAPVVYSRSGVKVSGGATTDANGNMVSRTTPSSNEVRYVDTRGYERLKVVTNPTSVVYHVLKQDGTYATTTVTRQPFYVQTNFQCAGVNEYSLGTTPAYLPSQITLPTGQSYTLEYEATPGLTDKTTARLKRVTLPTGGYYEYTYPGSNGGMNCSDGTLLAMNRTISTGSLSGTWDYTRAASGVNWVTTIKAPTYNGQRDETLVTFNSDRNEIQTEVYEGAAGSNALLQRVTRSWATNKTPAAVTIAADGRQTKTETDFDSLGLPLAQRDFDWGDTGTNTPGPALRTTTISYASLPATNMKDRVSQILVREGGPTATVKSRTDFAYDERTVYCASGTPPQRDSSFGCSNNNRGNQTSFTVYTNASAGTGAIKKNKYFDHFGNVYQEDSDDSQELRYTFDSSTQFALPTEIKRGGYPGPYLTTTLAYNANTGLLTSVTDENGKTTQFGYDTIGRPTSVTAPNSAQATTTYDDVNRVTVSESPIAGTTRARLTTYYDTLGRVVSQVTGSNAASAEIAIVETGYDALGRVGQVSNPFTTGQTKYWSYATYDALGRTLQVLAPDIGGTRNTTSSYWANTVTTSDPTGKQRKSETDGLGRIKKLFEPDPSQSNAISLETWYSYTVNGALKWVGQGVQNRYFNYDDAGRLASSVAPESGTTTYEYNTFHLLTKRTDARGVKTNHEYDGYNRLWRTYYDVSGTTVAATPQVTYTYGSNSTLNNNSRLTTMTDGTGSETYAYDSLGQILSVAKVVGAVTYTTSYTYNLAGDITKITYPSGREINYGYDNYDRLSTVQNGTTNIATGHTYNAAGQLTGFTYGNGVVSTLGFNAANLQLGSISYAKSGNTLFALSFWYGNNGVNNGQILNITDNLESGRTVDYAYDSLHRLTSAVTVGSSSYAKWGLSWVYDRYGNRNQQNLTHGSAPSFSVSASSATNQLPGYVYDAAGSVTYEPGVNYTYAYDAENRVVNARNGMGLYAYDGNGLRTTKVEGSTTTTVIYSGSQAIAEYVNGASPSNPGREYAYSGGLVATFSGNTLNYFHTDHLSTRLITDSTGNTVGLHGHYPYGEAWYDSGWWTPYGFTNYKQDTETGLQQSWFRSYSSRHGRFMTTDPYAGSMTISDSQSWNRYAYVHGDPVNSVDPLGLFLQGPRRPAPRSQSSETGPVGLGGDAPKARRFTENEPRPRPSWDVPLPKTVPTVCSGNFYVLRGNENHIGKVGGIPPFKIKSDSAGVDPFQFGAKTGADLRPIASSISGAVRTPGFGGGRFLFNGVAEVINSADIRGVSSGATAREHLRNRFPELKPYTLLELPGLPGKRGDPKVQPGVMYVSGASCPEGTFPPPPVPAPKVPPVQEVK